MHLAEFISSRPLVLLDGAMGTQLAARGLGMSGRTGLSHPDAVLDIHKAYAGAGADLLTANTFSMNRIYLETHGIAEDVRKVNQAGVKLARSAAGRDRYVLGDIGPTGQLLEPYGDYKEEQFAAAFREQAECLAAGGVDGFIVETMMDQREAISAVRACRDVSPLPVFATIAFQTADKGGRTIMGNTAAESASALAEAGAFAVGTNCGDLDPREIARIVAMMREAVDRPIIAQPNAGKPRLVDGRTVFDMPPEAFAEGLAECVAAGATLVGGCCGTTPDHIRLAADRLRKGSPEGI